MVPRPRQYTGPSESSDGIFSEKNADIAGYTTTVFLSSSATILKGKKNHSIKFAEFLVGRL